ncbi:1-acyl-sn-glycerol-3-phosphate acyltransferase [Cypionkella aquatica]|uniref:1-acyl-sn-glycerol-3-phosphate acyltransferase n=1 Tax=Cypionkella aquatica TaxID=1756042 RepID=A0AA37U069_9RHOB|nr:lysophospholipid acyltransferase family protein [Cypionkella aquatica]GLS87447.1 1-acyl-sn-glycerol-3-phosphate acyltransferase [Cypionkella aquatica]
MRTSPLWRPIQWLLSLIFILQMYLAMLVIGIAYLPYAVLNRDGAAAACHAFCKWVRLSLWLLCGLRTEIRGTVPQGEVLIAPKHQSFLDIILIYGALPRAKFIMKAELRFAPILGWYALRIGCVPVNRGKRGAAITKMMSDVRSGLARPGQLIIYPQGTRTAPGEVLPYKIGTAALYSQLGQPCVPVGTNVGLFWPKHGLMRHPGTGVVDFLPAIPPGLSNAEFMAQLEARVETSSNALMAEAGYP